MAVTIVKTNTNNFLKEDTITEVLAAQSVDETTSDAVDVFGASAISLMAVSSAGVSNGVVKLETSIDGVTYYVAGTVTTNAASSAFSDSLAAGDNGFPAIFARARIETVITGGTVDVYIAVQK